MNWRDLIAIAQALARGAVPPRIGRPRQAELRRALSTIYYAMFHSFAINTPTPSSEPAHKSAMTRLGG